MYKQVKGNHSVCSPHPVDYVQLSIVISKHFNAIKSSCIYELISTQKRFNVNINCRNDKILVEHSNNTKQVE